MRELDGGLLVLVLLVELDERSRCGIARGILLPRCRASFQDSISRKVALCLATCSTHAQLKRRGSKESRGWSWRLVWQRKASTS